MRDIKKDPNLTLYRFDDASVFDLQIGNRVLDTELVTGAEIPVYSANVLEEFGFIDKEILSDYSRDSIIWGIDGNWMVNVIPANSKFYPTDHCGVLVSPGHRD